MVMAKLLNSFLLLLSLTRLSISEEQQKLTISVKDIKPKVISSILLQSASALLVLFVVVYDSY